MLESGVVDRKFILENSDVQDKEAVEQRMLPLWEAERNAMLNQAAALRQPPQEGGM